VALQYLYQKEDLAGDLNILNYFFQRIYGEISSDDFSDNESYKILNLCKKTLAFT
jgi:hypothetical protein